MTYFLVETEYDGEPNVVLYDEATDLTDFLRKNFEQHYYTGDGEVIHGIYEYVLGGDGLRELVIIGGQPEHSEGDYLDYQKALHIKSDVEGFGPSVENLVCSYSVRIDGRA